MFDTIKAYIPISNVSIAIIILNIIMLTYYYIWPVKCNIEKKTSVLYNALPSISISVSFIIVDMIMTYSSRD